MGSHFLEATLETGQSELLRCFLRVSDRVLYQKGPAESKDPEKEEEVDREPRTRAIKRTRPYRFVRAAGCDDFI